MHKKKNYEKLPLWSMILFGVASVALLLLIVAVLSERFADWYNRTGAAFFRTVMALIACSPVF